LYFVTETRFWERSGRRDNSLSQQRRGEVFHGEKGSRKVRSAESFHQRDFTHSMQTAGLPLLLI